MAITALLIQSYSYIDIGSADNHPIRVLTVNVTPDELQGFDFIEILVDGKRLIACQNTKK